MVCLRNISVDTLHKEDTEDKNNIIIIIIITIIILIPRRKRDRKMEINFEDSGGSNWLTVKSNGGLLY
jgi:hypothetical protein